MAAAAALPLKFSPNFFVNSPQKWILQIVGDGARRARPRGERCKAPFIYAKKPPQLRRRKEKRKNLRTKSKNMIKYIVYCRKSTDEKEKQVLSIESQIAELKEFAAREKLNIVCFLTESRTAKIPGRPIFQEVIEKIEKGEANGILSWHPDRIARNSIDGGKIIYLLDTGKLLDLKFPTFWFDNTPQGKFMLSIAFGQSKYYVDNLSENVKRGNRQKLRKGILPNKAPYGYLNEPRLRTIEVEPVKSKIVKKAFELFAEGESSIADIARFFQKFGITKYNGKMLHLDTVKRVLSNKFYIGIINFGGETYEGTHKLFIQPETFEKIQKILAAREHPKNKKHNFTFLGLVRCAECGCAITAEVKHKCYLSTRGNVDYIYYRCTKKKTDCSQNYLREEFLEQQLRAIVAKSSLPASWANLWLEKLDKEEAEEKANSETAIAKLSSEIQEIDQKLDRLLEGYLDQIVDPQIYQQKKNELVELKIKLKEKMASISKNGSEWLGLMREFIEVAASAAKIARAKHNGEELSFFAKKVGSDYSLNNRRLFCVYKRGFAALAAGAGAASAIPDDLQNPFLWKALESK
jgi:DNA invertase Pin-like site-specific DNA recombinase